MPLYRLPPVTGAAGEHRARSEAAKLSTQDLRSVDLNIDEFPPGLIVGMETLHKSGIAIYAAIGAACVAIKGVITNTGAVQQALAGDLTNGCALHGRNLALLDTVVMLEQALLLIFGHGYES